ncbi:DUF342 domain-containing protein [Vibrio caribbeanicus]|uniref:Flagellar Assembly Protein A N-terminal region domain-containing protein n=1 Tax=Vibrio caribbeanicus ATCC BAA-2122 TaxID=796620 RepID=E3BGZ2_9VIBR|nr:FapA family protein [Vibrio caribbeanicus]EFP97629.1 hypothetical protein VIBC2010_00190 [Vibrio caribbeanicus ATCC BAA-2122]
MWDKLITFSDDKRFVIAKLSDEQVTDSDFNTEDLENALQLIDAKDYCLLQDEVTRFINSAKEMKSEAYEGITIAEVRDASIEVLLSDQNMLASMVVTGAYRGKPLKGPQIVHALAKAFVTKGINKLALKKVLVVSHQLGAGETFTQVVAKGKAPIQGTDTKFTPLVDDPTKQVLAPRDTNNDGKVDMLNLGETITVAKGQPLMRRTPATKGTPGLTVQGNVIPCTAGNESTFYIGIGTKVSPEDPNLLIAEEGGMPILQERGMDVEDALCLPNIGVATGHVKFKGHVVVTDNIESDMIVRATGSLTVGGFIESADVQAQGDINVAKGIIGHNVSEDQKRSCVVKAGGSITASYGQFSELQAGEDIILSIHCMNNDIRSGRDLIVCDSESKQGTLSGGHAVIGRRISCVNLGVEGDTATYVQAFALYQRFKDRQVKLQEEYNDAQERTIELVREELEFKKIPKGEREPEKEQQLELDKKLAKDNLEDAKSLKETNESEMQIAIDESYIEVKTKVFSHVTVQFGDEKVTTKRSHGPSSFRFDQYKIHVTSLLKEDDIEDNA